MPLWNLDHHEPADWQIASWANGAPFNAAWNLGNVDFSEGLLKLRLNDKPAPGSNLPYSSGEYRSRHLFSYGQFEVVMKAPSHSGVVSSFFLYTDGGDGHPHDEIDFEFLGRNSNQIQFNYHTSGVGTNRNEYYHQLPFDAAADFHRYAIRWQPGRIDWLVDGHIAHSDDGSRTGVPVPTHSMKIMLNLWVGSNVEEWLGPFNYQEPIEVAYRSISYI